MKIKHFLFSLALVLPISSWASSISTSNDSLLFKIAVGLMLTENFEEADACFEKLIADGVEQVTLHNNRGVNQAMWGLSLLKKPEAEGLIRYLFPFEVAPNLSSKGNDPEEKQRIAQITKLLEDAKQQFQICIEKDPAYSGAYLNLASVQAILSQWTENPTLLFEASETINLAEQNAKEGSTIKGYCLIVKGIIYDYLGNTDKRDEYFTLARQQHQVNTDSNLGSLIERNTSVASGEEPAFADNSLEKFNTIEYSKEKIDGQSLTDLITRGSLELDQTIASLGMAALYSKAYTGSTLYVYFQDANRYFFFHESNDDYPYATSMGIKRGDSEAYVLETYGTPLRTYPVMGGKCLYYKKAKLLFFIDDDGTVGSWMVWERK